MLDQALIVLAFVLLAGGVAGSLLPQVPGAPVSLLGVFVYWAGTGFAEPGPLVVAVLALVGLLTWAVDWLGGMVAAKVGGASTKTAVLAGLVGLAMFFLTGTGPLGMFLGVALTVFAAEYYRQRDARAGAKAAAVTTLGMLGTTVIQAIMTASILVAVVAVHLL